MSTIVVSHGFGASPGSVWYPWFAAELEADGHRVVIPALPEPDKPDPVSWRQALARATDAAPAADTVLVGHSIGGVNVLRMLEAHDGVFAGAVLVSTASHEVGYDTLAGFFSTPFDWDRIRAGARRFAVLAAADDPVNTPDPVEHVAELVRGLYATAVVLPRGGHLGAFPDDRIELPEAVRLTLDCLEVKHERPEMVRLGRSVLPQVLAVTVVLQALYGLTDHDALQALRCDLRWRAAWGWACSIRAFIRRC